MTRMQPQTTDAATIEAPIAALAANAVRDGAGKPLHLRRSIAVTRAAVDADARRIELSFSSEEPYERWFGIEILGHAPGECDLSWLMTGRAPLLVDHRSSDIVGIVEKAEIGADRKGRAVVRFGKSERADEVFADVVDGIRANVSVGYQIDELILVKTEGDVDTYRVTKWRPLEISMVSIPADMTVGVGKSHDDRAALLRSHDLVIRQPSPERGTTMITGTPAAAPAAVATAASPADLEALRAAARETEQTRVREIMALAELHNLRDFGVEHVRAGTALAEFRGALLLKLPAGRPLETATRIGMDRGDLRRYSIRAAILAQITHDWSDAKLEREASEEVAKRVGRRARGFFIPNDVMAEPRDFRRAQMQRDLTVGAAPSGGFLVATDLQSANMIDLLRNRMLVRRMGATVLTGLRDDVAIPKQTGAATAYWLSEGSAPTESQQTIGQVVLTPKTIGAFTDYSRKLLLQSSIDVENFIRNDLMLILALGVDLAALHGTGAGNQPMGIANTTGVYSVDHGANGGAPTWAKTVEFETGVAVANADVGTLGYLTNAKVRGKMKTTEKAANTGIYLWGEETDAEGMGMVNGYRAGVSNQCRSDLADGAGSNLSAAFFGNWADLLIGEWGVLDIFANPYSEAAQGNVRVHAFDSMDTVARRAESFSYAADIITT